MDLEVVGIILARGGSKSVPRKNLRAVAGKPLIAWTIEAALQSSVLARVIVSTDDAEIAEVGRRWGAEVPFLRPPELACDDTPSIEPILHALRWLDEHGGYRPDYVMLLQPTSPLRTAEDIRAAVGLVRERQGDSVVSVCAAHQHPYWMKKVTEDAKLVDFLRLDRSYTRRQDLPAAYYIDGAIYVARCDVLVERETFYTERTYAYIIPPERSLDIDTLWDLYLANLVLEDRMRVGND